MNPRWLLWLYPRSWRERYEDEFLALLEAEGLTRRVVLDVVRSVPGEWVQTAVRWLGWERPGDAASAGLRALCRLVFIGCAVHVGGYLGPPVVGWLFGEPVHFNPAWFTAPGVALSAAFQMRTAVLTAVVGLGVPLLFERASHKTRRTLLDLVYPLSIGTCLILNSTVLLDVVPANSPSASVLGPQFHNSLAIPVWMLVGSWAKAVGERRLDPEPEAEGRDPGRPTA